MCVDVDRYKCSEYIFVQRDGLPILIICRVFLPGGSSGPSWRNFRPGMFRRSPVSAFVFAVFVPWPEVPALVAGSSGQRNFRPTSGQVPEMWNCG